MAEKKILIVSGDPALLDFLQENLSAGGYDVMSTEDNEQGLKTLLDKASPDLVILDITMPKMQGVRICVRIRQRHDVPVIMLTTWKAGKDKVKGLDLRANDYLTDSIDIGELMAWIKETFSRNGSGNGSKRLGPDPD